MKPLPLRARLALVFTGGFALLLALGAWILYLQLARAYRRDFDSALRDGARAARAVWTIDRPEYTTPEAAVAHAVGELIYGDRTIVAFGASGSPLVASQRLPGAPYFNDARPTGPVNVPQTARLRDGEARILRVPLAEGIELVLAMDRAPLERRLKRLRVALLAGLPAILVVGAVLGAWGAGLVLRPVVEVASTAERVGQEVAEGRLAFTAMPARRTADELSTLTDAFNLLVDRLSAALHRERDAAERQRQFLADAAHELRTPAAILLSEAEVALGGRAEPAEYRAALQRIVAESQELGALVNDLLLVARGDANAIIPVREPVYLDDLANRVIARARNLPAAAGRELRRGEFEAAPVSGDQALLERAILALVHNALIHAPNAPVELSTGTRADNGRRLAWLTVRDWGPGVSADQRGRVFERFARLQTGAPGTGLGLSIARTVATAHGGTVTLDEVTPGAAFTLKLPAIEVSGKQ